MVAKVSTSGGAAAATIAAAKAATNPAPVTAAGSPPPATTTPPAAATNVPDVNPLTGNSSYSDIINNTLAQWGLSSLASLVTQWGTTGASTDEINLQLQQTQQYKSRFSGNDARVASGLPPLSPADYIAMEGSYRSTLQQYGLPAGFYDTQEGMANFIGNDVSAAEFASRVQIAATSYVNADAGTKAAWNQYYGAHGDGGAIAAILDPTVAEPLLQQEATAAGIGGAAINQGLQATSASRALNFAQQGVTIDTAKSAYQDIATRAAGDQAESARYGPMSAVDQATEEDATLGGNADAQNKMRVLGAEESSQFTGHGAATESSNDSGDNY